MLIFPNILYSYLSKISFEEFEALFILTDAVPVIREIEIENKRIETTQDKYVEEEKLTLSYELLEGELPIGITFNETTGEFSGFVGSEFRIINPSAVQYFSITRGINYEEIYKINVTGRNKETAEFTIEEGELPIGITLGISSGIVGGKLA